MDNRKDTQARTPAKRAYVRPEVRSEPATEKYALFTSCGGGNQTQVIAGDTCCAAGY